MYDSSASSIRMTRRRASAYSMLQELNWWMLLQVRLRAWTVSCLRPQGRLLPFSHPYLIHWSHHLYLMEVSVCRSNR